MVQKDDQQNDVFVSENPKLSSLLPTTTTTRRPNAIPGEDQHKNPNDNNNNNKKDQEQYDGDDDDVVVIIGGDDDDNNNNKNINNGNYSTSTAVGGGGGGGEQQDNNNDIKKIAMMMDDNNNFQLFVDDDNKNDIQPPHDDNDDFHASSSSSAGVGVVLDPVAKTNTTTTTTTNTIPTTGGASGKNDNKYEKNDNVVLVGDGGSGWKAFIKDTSTKIVDAVKEEVIRVLFYDKDDENNNNNNSNKKLSSLSSKIVDSINTTWGYAILAPIVLFILSNPYYVLLSWIINPIYYVVLRFIATTLGIGFGLGLATHIHDQLEEWDRLDRLRQLRRMLTNNIRRRRRRRKQQNQQQQQQSQQSLQRGGGEQQQQQADASDGGGSGISDRDSGNATLVRRDSRNGFHGSIGDNNNIDNTFDDDDDIVDDKDIMNDILLDGTTPDGSPASVAALYHAIMSTLMNDDRNTVAAAALPSSSKSLSTNNASIMSRSNRSLRQHPSSSSLQQFPPPLMSSSGVVSQFGSYMGYSSHNNNNNNNSGSHLNMAGSLLRSTSSSSSAVTTTAPAAAAATITSSSSSTNAAAAAAASLQLVLQDEQTYGSLMQMAGYNVMDDNKVLLRGQVIRKDDDMDDHDDDDVLAAVRYPFMSKRATVVVVPAADDNNNNNNSGPHQHQDNDNNNNNDYDEHANDDDDYDDEEQQQQQHEDQLLRLQRQQQQQQQRIQQQQQQREEDRLRAVQVMTDLWPSLPSSINRELGIFMELILRDYVSSWYSLIDNGCQYREEKQKRREEELERQRQQLKQEQEMRQQQRQQGKKNNKAGAAAAATKTTTTKTSTPQRVMLYELSKHRRIPFLDRLYECMAVVLGNLAARCEHVNVLELVLLKWTKVLAHTFKSYRMLRKSVVHKQRLAVDGNKQQQRRRPRHLVASAAAAVTSKATTAAVAATDLLSNVAATTTAATLGGNAHQHPIPHSHQHYQQPSAQHQHQPSSSSSRRVSSSSRTVVAGDDGGDHDEDGAEDGGDDVGGASSSSQSSVPVSEIAMTKEFFFTGKLHRAITFGLDVPSLLFADKNGDECGRPNKRSAVPGDGDGDKDDDGAKSKSNNSRVHDNDDDALLALRLFDTNILRECEVDYNRVVAYRMVRSLMPRQEFGSPIVSTLVTEIMASCVLTPVMSCFGPNDINGWIIQGLLSSSSSSSGPTKDGDGEPGGGTAKGGKGRGGQEDDNAIEGRAPPRRIASQRKRKNKKNETAANTAASRRRRQQQRQGGGRSRRSGDASSVDVEDQSFGDEDDYDGYEDDDYDDDEVEDEDIDEVDDDDDNREFPPPIVPHTTTKKNSRSVSLDLNEGGDGGADGSSHPIQQQQLQQQDDDSGFDNGNGNNDGASTETGDAIITCLAMSLIELQRHVDFEESRMARENFQEVQVTWENPECRSAVLRLVLVIEAALTHGRCTYRQRPQSQQQTAASKLSTPATTTIKEGEAMLDDDGSNLIDSVDGLDASGHPQQEQHTDVEVTLPEYESATLSQILMEMTSDIEAFEERVATENTMLAAATTSEADDAGAVTTEPENASGTAISPKRNKYEDMIAEEYKPTSTEQSTLRTLIAAWLHTGQIYRTVTLLAQAHATVLSPYYTGDAFLRNRANANGFARQLRALDGVDIMVDTMAVLASPRLGDINKNEDLTELVRRSGASSSFAAPAQEHDLVTHQQQGGGSGGDGGGGSNGGMGNNSNSGMPTSFLAPQFMMPTATPRHLDFHRNESFAASLRSERERRALSWQSVVDYENGGHGGVGPSMIHRTKGAVKEEDVAKHKELHHLARIFYTGTNLLSIRDAARRKTSKDVVDGGGSVSAMTPSVTEVESVQQVSLLTLETACPRRRIEVPDDDSSFLLRAQPRPLNAVGVHRDPRSHDQSFKCFAATYDEPALNHHHHIPEHYAGGRYVRRCLIRYYPIDRTATVNLQTTADTRKLDQRKSRSTSVPETITVGQSRPTHFLSSDFLRERYLCRRWVPKGTTRSQSILASSVMEPNDFTSMPRTGRAIDFVYRLTFFERPMIDLGGKHFTVNDSSTLGPHRADASSLELSDAALSTALAMLGSHWQDESSSQQQQAPADQQSVTGGVEMGKDGYPRVWMQFSRKHDDAVIEVKPYRISFVRAALLVTAARQEAQLQCLVKCVKAGSAKKATKALTDAQLRPCARLLEYAGNRSREKQSLLLRDLKLGVNHIDREQLRRNGLLSPRYPTVIDQISAQVEDAVPSESLIGVSLFGATGPLFKIRCIATVELVADEDELVGDVCYRGRDGRIARSFREEWVVYRSLKDFQTVHKQLKAQVNPSLSSGTAGSRLVGAATAAFATSSGVQARQRKALIPSMSQVSKVGNLANTTKNMLKKKAILNEYLEYILAPGHLLGRCPECLLFLGAFFPLSPEVRVGRVVSGVPDSLGRTEMSRTILTTHDDDVDDDEEVETKGQADSMAEDGISSNRNRSSSMDSSTDEADASEVREASRRSRRKIIMNPAIQNKIDKVPLTQVRNRIFELLRYQFGFENASFIRSRMLAALKTASFAVTSPSEFRRMLYNVHTEHINAESIAGWIKFTSDLLWPDGIFMTASPPPTAAQLEEQAGRSKQALHDSFPDQLRAVLGPQLTKDGLNIFHEMLQNRVVVKSMAYMLFDLLYVEIFPEIGDVLQGSSALEVES